MYKPQSLVPTFMIQGALKRVVQDGDEASSKIAKAILEGPETEYEERYKQIMTNREAINS